MDEIVIFAMNIIKKIFSKTRLYRFVAWQWNRFNEEEQLKQRLRPDQFREYGQGVRIDPDVRINMPSRVVLKDRVMILRGCNFNTIGGLYVGENSGFGMNCTLWTWQHRYLNSECIPYDANADLKPVIIRDFVWIGAHVQIVAGIEIGEGAIVGMGSVVTKSVPPFAIVMGNPATIIGYRDKEHFLKCKAEKKFGSLTLVGNYKENIVKMFKIRYEKELKELGLM